MRPCVRVVLQVARSDALTMGERGAIELREYLRRRDPPPDGEFDEFLWQVEVFYKLRVRSVERFVERSHTANGWRGALPLDWKDIATIVEADEASPPESVITQFARDCMGVAEEILTSLRKVLVREREKVSLGLVQQVDPHCLRWLTRQPGRDGVEKAGARQRILAVVRRENYNTLENRVFKDFLARAGHEASIYLRKNEKRFPNHDVIKRVRRLGRLCEEGVREPLLEGVGEIRELPVPNYVLRQERRYTKVWKAYVELIRQASVAERLWDRRDEVATTLNKLRMEAPRQTDPRARFHAPIWFNPLDGRHALLDLPFYENAWGNASVFTTVPQQDDVVVDMTGGSLRWDLLIDGQHSNAKPYLQDYAKPSIEDRETGNRCFLSDILEQRDAVRLRDYLEQLHARLGGKRWFVLVPDDWDALWQEAIIKAMPLARNHVFLIWRSVAAAIAAIPQLDGAEDGDELAVVDVLQNGNIRLTRLALTHAESGKHLVPQRKAFKHGQANGHYGLNRMRQTGCNQDDVAFLEGKHARFSWPAGTSCQNFISGIRHVILVSEGNVIVPEDIKRCCSIIGDRLLLEDGVEQFAKCLSTGRIAYYDELEALSLIVQTEDENVIAKTLVEANEKWPGGRVMATPLLERAAVLKRGEDHVRFMLCMGDTAPDSALKIKKHEFASTLEEDQALDLAVRMTPGQGMAVVSIHAGFLRNPIELDFLHGMSDKDENDRRLTIATVEDKMLRSFPPDAPHVVADLKLWNSVSANVKEWFKSSMHAPDGGWFAKAADLYTEGEPLPEGVKAIERLRRKNVFGNDPEHRYPTNGDFSALFAKLRTAYGKAEQTSDPSSEYAKIVRLIAWTYQSDYRGFDDVRKETVNRIAKYAKGHLPARPLPQEYTLCANLCNKAHEWKTLWDAVCIRLRDKSDENNVEEDLRLLYNLLQFHPTLLQDTKLCEGDACWEMMQKLLYWYPRYNEGGMNGSKRIGYVLKCILYLLRCRRFDGKVFVTRERDNERYKKVRRCLISPLMATGKLGLHHVVCDYLDGRGTIAGVPTS